MVEMRESNQHGAISGGEVQASGQIHIALHPEGVQLIGSKIIGHAHRVDGNIRVDQLRGWREQITIIHLNISLRRQLKLAIEMTPSTEKYIAFPA